MNTKNNHALLPPIYTICRSEYRRSGQYYPELLYFVFLGVMEVKGSA